MHAIIPDIHATNFPVGKQTVNDRVEGQDSMTKHITICCLRDWNLFPAELISCPLACPPAWPKTNALKPFVKRGRHSFYLNLHWLASLQLYDEIDSRSFRPISTTAIVRSSSHHQRKRRCKMFVTEGTTDNTYAEPQSRLAVESELFFSRCISYAEELNGD